MKVRSQETGITVGPYDAIHVGAAAPTMPQALIDQLNTPGKLFIPVGPPGDQYITEVVKDKDGKISTTRLYGVMYVPLCDRPNK